MNFPRKFVGNFLSLSSIQVINYILPLITLPYIVRILGPHDYGLVMFAQAIAQYFVLLTSYGFNLSATPQVALRRGNVNEIAEILSSVLAAKLLLTAVSFILLLIAVFIVPSFRVHWVLFFVSFGYVLADVALPTWLFQGLEDMKFMTLANVTTKVISTILIFSLIRHPGDYLLLPIVMTSSSIVGGLLSFIIASRKHQLRIRRTSVHAIWHQLKDGWLIFISTLSISLYTTSNPVILGIFSTPTVVGYYVAAEKLINAGQSLLGVVSQTIYPHVARVIHDSTAEGLRFLHRVTMVLAPTTFGISIAIIVLSHPVVSWLLGDRYMASLPILRILSILPFLISLSNIFGIQAMLNLGMKQAFSRIIIIGALVNLVLSFSLVPLLGATGTAVSVTISEVVITFGMYVILSLKGINLITGRIRSDY